MEPLQKQVHILEERIGALEASILALPTQVISALNAAQVSAPASPVGSVHAHRLGHTIDHETHSFLLDEDMSSSTRSMSLEMPPEAQVQRLTAQLTAAYNRIAALEEQLLAQRLLQ